MDSGDSKFLMMDSVNNKDSSKDYSPQQRKGSSKVKRYQSQSPPVTNCTRGNQTPNLQSTPELVTKHYMVAKGAEESTTPESLLQEDLQNPYRKRSPHICFNSNPEVLSGLQLPGDQPPGSSYPKLDLLDGKDKSRL